MNDKITKIDIITRPEMLDELKAALNEIGVRFLAVVFRRDIRKFIVAGPMILTSCLK